MVAHALRLPSGTVVAVESGHPGAWVVMSPCQRIVQVASGTPIDTTDVVLDPGHGGAEPGAVGADGYPEKIPNLAVAKLVSSKLAAMGISSVLTRNADYQMTLTSRAEIANKLQPKAFVAIHFNAEPDGPSSKPGTETYYQLRSTASKRLAGILYEDVFGFMKSRPVAWVADSDAGAKYRTNSHGDDYYGVLRQTHGVASTIVETAFISNPPEEAEIRTASFQDELASALASGIKTYVTTNEPGGGYVTPYFRTPSPGTGGQPTPSCKDTL